LPLGGILDAGQSLVADLDGNGRPETVTVTGGRVVASHVDGSTLWTTGLIGPVSILGAWDLAGAGSVQVVVATTGGVLVLSGATGHQLTSLAPTPPVSAVFAQETKGGILVLAAPGGGNISGYDFRSGTSVTSAAWTITGANQALDLVGDVDGDGAVDLVRPLNDGFEVDNPITGAVKYSFSGMSPSAYFYLYELANVDGNPGVEIVAFDTSYQFSPSCGVYVVGYQSGGLHTLWSSTASPSAALGADYTSVAGSVADLEGNGSLELVYSTWDGTASKWTTVIANAATGTQLGTIVGELVQAVADIDGDGKAEIVVRSGAQGNQLPSRSTVSAYDFDSMQAGPVAKSWSVSLAHVTGGGAATLPSADLVVPAVADFDPTTTGLELLLGEDKASAGADTDLVTIHGGDGSGAGDYLAPTANPLVLGVANAITASTSANDVVVGQDNGSVHLLDHALSDHVHFSAGTYANWIRSVAGAMGYANLFAQTSNNHLAWIDARQIHADGTPYVRYDEPGVVSTLGFAKDGFAADPIVFLNGVSSTLVTFEQATSNVVVIGHGASGVISWSTSLDPGTTVYSPGAYAVDLNGDGNDDLVLSLFDRNSVESLAAFDGTSGVLLRSLPISSIVSSASLWATGALVDVNGDGHPDLVTPECTSGCSFGGVVAVNLYAQPFSQIWLETQPSLPVIFQGTVGFARGVDGGNGGDLLRSNGNNGFGPYEAIALDGSVVAHADQGLTPGGGNDENAAAMVTNGAGGFDLLSAGVAGAGLSRVRRISGSTMATVWTQYVANGAVSSSAPTQGYALHDPIVFDADGNGVDDVIFGSDDGYLYALSSSDGTLTFAVNLSTPVSHVIAANVDLDSQLELVASLSDGRLVGLDDKYQANRDQSDGGIDGGSLDGSAESGVEAGSDATVEASADASADASQGSADAAEGGGDASESDAGRVSPSSMGGGGCGCTAAGSRAAPYGLLLSIVGVAIAAARSRRGGRRKR
jgi:hypothetical protein